MLRIVVSTLALLVTMPVMAAGQVVIRNVTVVDVAAGEARPGMTVVVEDDRIVSVTEAAGAAARRDAEAIDGSGKFLVPGLWDMHVHLNEASTSDLVQTIAAGVTSVRDMGTPMSAIETLRRDIAAGRTLGPRIKAPGMMITNAMVWNLLEERLPPEQFEREKLRRLRVETPEQAREAVRRASADGADFVKLHWNQSPETYAALADECRELGLTFAGHDPLGGIPLVDIAAAGQRSIEHIDGAFAMQLSQAGEDGRGEIVSALVEHETHFVPTIVTFLKLGELATVATPDERLAMVMADPRAEHLGPDLLEFWRVFIELFQQLPPASFFDGPIEELARLHASGVRMMVGTDLAAPLVFPGTAVHEELALFVERVGMTPAEALRAATLYPAEFFGLEHELGTIEEGKLADLVLLGANPLDDIGALGSIEAVVVAGRVLDVEDLAELSEQAAGG